ncbi:uncharacterized protein C8Q71DRAFT_776835 [Rhodofomes roseus]|uniref:GST N-terminal domain-containing protein n=1 Tax=Rhodofomes roseus TaxID=34475 RepID=A0ABQ8K638_9APHY|nr:uncharacterized protein C8Q71DRAFT_776835 [Rhodofomes roseus]KAH9832522.1 hypothetical protein C8Q71DRAFT_776835 [Rhodofomes roseus]
MTLPDTDKLVFYDIRNSVPGCAWSPNTWKTRLALNHKGIPYRTEWVEYPDIAPLLSAVKVEPNPPSSGPIPVQAYTLPAIYDPRTQKTIMDSYKIALYLDETYPDTPALLPPESRVFQTSFQHALGDVLHTRVVPLLLHQIAKPLNPRSRDYFIETREAFLGCKLEELSPPGSEKNAAQWVAMEKAFGVVASWIESAGDGRLLLSGGGPDGEDGKVTHADTDLAGVLIAMRVLLGVDSKEWERIEGFDGGRWKRYLTCFKFEK